MTPWDVRPGSGHVRGVARIPHVSYHVDEQVQIVCTQNSLRRPHTGRFRASSVLGGRTQIDWRECMGIEPTRSRLRDPSQVLKTRAGTSRANTPAWPDVVPACRLTNVFGPGWDRQGRD